MSRINKNIFSQFFSQFFDRCFSQCLLCLQSADSEISSALCSRCVKALPWIEAQSVCERCALEVSSEGICGACQLNPPPYASLKAWLHYTPVTAYLLKRFKYQRSLLYGRWWLDLLKHQYSQLPRVIQEAPWCTVPLHYRRYWIRGFNQTGELLKGLKASERMFPEIIYPLEKLKHTAQQSRRSKEARRLDVSADLWRWRAKVPVPERIVIFEDVVTTGATLKSVTEACLEAGVKRVDAVALIRVV